MRAHNAAPETLPELADDYQRLTNTWGSDTSRTFAIAGLRNYDRSKLAYVRESLQRVVSYQNGIARERARLLLTSNLFK